MYLETLLVLSSFVVEYAGPHGRCDVLASVLRPDPTSEKIHSKKKHDGFSLCVFIVRKECMAEVYKQKKSQIVSSELQTRSKSILVLGALDERLSGSIHSTST